MLYTVAVGQIMKSTSHHVMLRESLCLASGCGGQRFNTAIHSVIHNFYDRSLGNLSEMLHNAWGESAGWLSPVWLRVPSVSRLLRYMQSSTSALTCLTRIWLQYVRARHCQKRPVCLSVCLPFAIVSRAFTVHDIKILFKGRGRYGLFR